MQRRRNKNSTLGGGGGDEKKMPAVEAYMGVWGHVPQKCISFLLETGGVVGCGGAGGGGRWFTALEPFLLWMFSK